MSSAFSFMSDGRRLGRIAGIDITIASSFLPLAAILTFSLADFAGSMIAALVMVLLLAVSIIAHELGHALTARSFGIRTRSITLHLLGGVAKIEGEPRRPAHEILIAAAGPAVSLALAGLFFATSLLVSLAALPGSTVFLYLTISNLGLAIFNLLPGLPLDGGRILRGVLWARSGDRRRATITAARGGEFLAYAVFVLAFLNLIDPNGGIFRALLPAVMGWFLLSAARAEKQRAEAEGQGNRGLAPNLAAILSAFAEATGADRARRNAAHGQQTVRPGGDPEVIRFPDGRELYTGRRSRSD